VDARQRGARDFRITPPANWYLLDLDPATRDESAAKLVEHRFGGADDPEVVAARREFELPTVARRAQQAGVVRAALMDMVVDGVPLSASLMVVLGTAPRDSNGKPAADPETLSRLLLALGDSGGAAGDGGEPAEAVTLPAGPAVRVRRVTGGEPSGTNGTDEPTAETRYFVAVPDSDAMLVLTFVTPNVDYRWHFDELFDRIARTLEWT